MPYLYYHGSMDRLPLLNKNVSHLKILYVSPFIAHTIHTFVMLLLVLLLLLLTFILLFLSVFFACTFYNDFHCESLSLCVSVDIFDIIVWIWNTKEIERERETSTHFHIVITICIYHLIACTPSSSSLFILLHFRLFVQMKSKA